MAAGFGGGPRISIYDGKSLSGGAYVHPFNDFFAFEDTLRNGAYVAVGNVNGSGPADLIVGGGPGGAPRVRVADGELPPAAVASGNADPIAAASLADFYAGDRAKRGGVRITADDLDGDGFADVVAGDGGGDGSHVAVYSGVKLPHDGSTPDALLRLDAFAGFAGGVYVG